MSRITGSEVASLMEAYNAVYASQELTEEQIWEEVENWVNSLLEEGYDLSEYTWEEMYESYLEETWGTNQQLRQQQQQKASEKKAQEGGTRKALERGKVVGVAGGLGFQSGTKVKMDSAATRAGGRTVLRATTSQSRNDPEKSIRLGGSSYDRLTTKDGVRYIERKTPSKAPDPKTEPKPEPKPDQNIPATTPAAPKVAPKPSASPKLAPTGLTGVKALATAAAEKARIRGTSETDNPLMKNMRSRMAAPTSAQSPDVAKLGKGNQSLVNNPNVAKPTPSPDARAIAARASVANVTAPEVKATNTAAATPKPTPVAPKAPMAGRDQMLQRNLRNGMEYDAYDIVLEYLLSEGHVETVEEAHYVMMEMDAETIGTIVEAAADQSDKQIDKGVRKTYAAQAELNNQRSRGLNRLPATQRAAKEKRMRGRLKARRDDLFGERNRREDAAREEIRKKYGF